MSSIKLTPGTETKPQEKNTYVRHYLSLILLITVFIAFLDRINVSIMIVDPKFLEDFGIVNSPTAKGLLMSTFLLCYGLGNIILGSVGDWLGPRKAMMVAILSWTIACVVGGMTTTFAIFLATRALLGFGEGLHWPMQSVFIKNWFPNNERGKANSTYLIGLNLAPVLGIPIFSVAILAIGWQGTMFSLASIGCVPFVLIWYFTADHPHLHKRISKTELDYIEAGLKEDKKAAKDDNVTVLENIKEIVSNYRFWLVVIFYCGSCSILWGIMAWFPSYLKEARGFSWAAMGALASLPFVLKVIVMIFSGYLSDKVGRRAPFMAISLYGAAICIGIAAYVSDNIASALLISVGMGFLSLGTPAVWALLQNMLPAKATGTGAGMMNGFSNGFSAIAPLAIGLLISVTGGYAGGLMYLVICGLVGGTAGLILTLKGL